MTGRRVHVLLTEGSSLSARQTLHALGPLNYVIDVCDPRPWFCLARYSRYVRRCYRCPPFAIDPSAYLDWLITRLRAERYDVLLPVHDQAYLLARVRDRLPCDVALPLPEFAAVDQVQSKAKLLRVLDELGLPHPPTQLVHTRAELVAACRFPCYVKCDYSTAGQGTWLVRDPDEFRTVADSLERAGRLDGQGEVLVQEPAPGMLGVVQSVFQHGRLVAAHGYLARALGVGGSARARVSVAHPLVLRHLASLGEHLRWHGALMLDHIWDPATQTPAYIDASPRIGETLNATLSGINLCDVLLRVALGESVSPLPPGRLGTQTHSVFMGLLALAERGASRMELLAELCRAWLGHDIYAHSQDELTRPTEDWPSILPAALVTVQLLLRPASAAATISRTVAKYALNEAAVKRIRGMK
jgi:hypothetical protein